MSVEVPELKFWVDDRLVPASEARVSVLDHGFTVGDGVFETCRTTVTTSTEVVPFAMDRHVARLLHSAVGLGLAAPNRELVEVAMLAVCAANSEQLRAGGRVRVTYTSGVGGAGSVRGAGPGTLVVTASATTPLPTVTTVALSKWARNDHSPICGLKTISYAENAVALAHARALGASDALLCNQAGLLCEGTGSNIFVEFADRVVTPALAVGLLAGTTRELLLEWGAEAGLAVGEGELTPEDLTLARGCFLTSTMRGVQRVERVLTAAGDVLVAYSWPISLTGEPADLTAALAELLARRSAADPNP